MIVIFGADHAGSALKQRLIDDLSARQITTLDLGTGGQESVDYPDYAHHVSTMLRRDEGIGVLICGTGIGMAIAANRHDHIRCAVATNEEMARLARLHNNANVLALGARLMDEETASRILAVFLTTAYEGGRHDARLRKLAVPVKL